MRTSIIFAVLLGTALARYEPNWNSLDSRPLPSWYDDGKIGIFIHWGVFSVPAFGSEWFWWNWQGSKTPAYTYYMQQNYRPDFTYADFGPMFHAEFYKPDDWADIFQASGANYVVLVSKHHEGFTNWPSKYSFNWNAMDVGPKRDLVGDLANSIRSKTNLKFGVYHSMFEWFHPLFLQDQANNFQTQDFVRTKTMPELYELVNTYKPDIVWSDGEWMAPDTYWNSTEFIAWLYNDSPVKDTVVVNDRWGNNTRCAHGGFWDCDDRFTPGKLIGHKWENCMTLDKYSWGFRANAKLQDILTIEELLSELANTVSLGGNLLINVGPTSFGQILPVYEERFRQLGAWLKVNGEAIYKSGIWTYQSDNATAHVWYTTRTDGPQPVVYAILLNWPRNFLVLSRPNADSGTKISLLGYPNPLTFTSLSGGGVNITIPVIPANEMPCEWAWVIKMEGLANHQPYVSWDAISRNVESIRMRKDSV
ncbi:alpha-L-fucosidase [Biomphalaria glabrata]|uniref:alpha-L-fucosidase n=1 Tax=Biomphalaria glabrata TaxID=6526 RepID=A0A9W2ZSE8_BIOGL|nr:alpha-L-fucosidase-like [Biomphalaria glabrata]KAI8731362.1 alpha-L-fucosidase-like; partial [Biomphalaria glabrata]